MREHAMVSRLRHVKRTEGAWSVINIRVAPAAADHVFKNAGCGRIAMQFHSDEILLWKCARPGSAL